LLLPTYTVSCPSDCVGVAVAPGAVVAVGVAPLCPVAVALDCGVDVDVPPLVLALEAQAASATQQSKATLAPMA
jgi:hypothetical protein